MFTLRNIAIIVFFLWVFVDGVVVFRHKTGKAENRDRFSMGLLMVGGLLSWPLSIFLAFTALAPIGSIPLQSAGLVLMGIGILVRSTAIAQLGRFHSPNVAILEDHQLMDTGLYRHVRHPSYLGGMIAFLGFGLALGSWWSVLVIMSITPCLYLYRIHEEERALGAAFGDRYLGYCSRTKRLIPGLY